MKTKFLAVAIAAAVIFPASALAAVSAAEAAKLGQSLTPMGAEKAGNKSGTIPAWTGGLSKIPSSFVPGGHYPDPFADEKAKFTITPENFDKYADNLTPGQIALLKRYPDWKMKVYPTHRTARYPEAVYADTRQNATQVKLVQGGNGFSGTTDGVPFPIPQSGVEAIWNHLTAYRGDTYATSWAQAPVTAGGDYNLVQFDYELDYSYGNQKRKPSERQDNLLTYFLQIIKEPARLAGTILLVHEFTDQVKTPRKAWTYNPGQRRVRLAPNVAYDNPGTAADGLRTNDDFGMFTGATDRYDWSLVGKKEIYVPYNAYLLNGPKLKIKDVLRPGHINGDHARYELHRVWVVDAKLKAGTSHIYKRRTFYLDEDSWQVLVTEKYDRRDQLWRVDEMHPIEYYDVPFLASGLEAHHDLQSGRYIALSLRNEQAKVYQPIERTPADFTPDALRIKGTR